MAKTSHTNVSVPRYSETGNSRQYAILEAEMKFWKAQAEYLQSELANIPRAIGDWGHCDIRDEDGKLWRLVLDKETSA